MVGPSEGMGPVLVKRCIVAYSNRVGHAYDGNQSGQ